MTIASQVFSDVLRPYQERDELSILEAWETHKSILYQLPTGGGKSVVASKLIWDHKNEKILFLAHRRRLLTQMQKRLTRLGLNTGLIVGGISENIDANIIIASIQTVTKDLRLAALINKGFDRIIIDEAHRSRTKSYENLLDGFKHFHPEHKLLGITATPYRIDGKSLGEYYETLIVSDPIDKLIKDGYLSPYKVFKTTIGQIDSEVELSGAEYRMASLSKYMMKEVFLDYLVESYKREADHKQMIVFCVDKKHGHSVEAHYKKAGYKKIAYVDSDTSEEERERILEAFESKEVEIIVCIEILTEGTDLPDTECIQFARPTKSLVLYMQMAGRGMRVGSSNEPLIILDCAGNTERFGTISSPKNWSLDPNVDPTTPSKQNKIVGRRKDGSYTEDETEMDFTELVELTPEEYLEEIGGNVEQAKKFNSDLELKIKEQLLKVGQFIVSKLKNKQDYEAVFKNGRWQDEELSIIHRGNEDFYLALEFDSRDKGGIEAYFLKVSLREGSRMPYHKSEYSEKQVTEYLQNNINLGLCYEVYLNHKEAIGKLYRSYVDLKTLTINIVELEKVVSKFKQNQIRKEIENFAMNNTIFELKSGSSLGQWTRDQSGRFNEVVLNSPKIKSLNEVSFYENKNNERYHQGTIKSMQKEKLLSLLEKHWK